MDIPKCFKCRKWNRDQWCIECKYEPKDLVDVVRCKNCKYCNRDITIERNKDGLEVVVNECTVLRKCVNDMDYCSWGERRAEQ